MSTTTPGAARDLLIRTSATALLVAVLVVLGAGPALAHGRGSDASNYLSTITDDPDAPGVEWRVVNSDEYMEVTATGDAEVQIPGYVDEPYLRVGPDGVFRNRNSQATYINEDRFGDVSSRATSTRAPTPTGSGWPTGPATPTTTTASTGWP
ncbi:hypothetical protein [Euzebya sp.]|uniref:hypothetical protein n=1 Tax=Euzebya sp. TaxID=1971409 RepID=UPI003517E753